MNESSEKLKISQYYSIKEHNNFKYIDSLIDILPFSLKQDIFYDLNCGLLRRSLILKELPVSILKRLSLAMKTVILASGESIYFQYAVKTCMVCVEDGILEVLNDEDQESPLIFFRNGTVLGKFDYLFRSNTKIAHQDLCGVPTYIDFNFFRRNCSIFQHSLKSHSQSRQKH